MQRAAFPRGETTASRIKTLVLHLERVQGRAAADALLGALQLASADLDDETRPIGVALWHLAAETFAATHGRDQLQATWPGVVAPENLGVWTRVLRGTTSPADAFRQLNSLGTDELRTGRWETIEAAPGRWRGRISMAYDQAFESDGLLALARAAELRAIPVFFGFAPGVVSLQPAQPGTFASRTSTTGQEYLVTWAETSSHPTALGGGTGALAGGVAAFLGFHQPLLGVAGAALVGGLGAVVGLLVQRDAQRRAEARAQRYRLQALERGMLLQEESSRAALPLAEGSVLAGLYRLGPHLGTGASGIIHRAVRLSDSLPVAVKLLRSAVAHDAVASDRLRREAEAMGLAWHPNVVELFDQGTLPNGSSYIVMELLEGESLAMRLKRRGTLPAAELAPLALQICDALSAVHAAGVIHRDIKPSNVFLLRPEGDQPERVKLLDFGIASVEWAETRLTQFGAPIGTPGYMSPEQEAGDEVDARCDLYSVGALLLECLTGKPYVVRPRRPPSLPDEQETSAEDPIYRDSGVQRSSSGVSPAWWALIERARQHDPRDRFPDARALREAIAAAQASESSPATLGTPENRQPGSARLLPSARAAVAEAPRAGAAPVGRQRRRRGLLAHRRRHLPRRRRGRRELIRDRRLALGDRDATPIGVAGPQRVVQRLERGLQGTAPLRRAERPVRGERPRRPDHLDRPVHRAHARRERQRHLEGRSVRRREGRRPRQRAALHGEILEGQRHRHRAGLRAHRRRRRP
jgi:serine/threonine-protein kinase